MVNEANEIIDQQQMFKEEKFNQWRNGSINSKGHSYKRENSMISGNSIFNKNDMNLQLNNDPNYENSFSDTVPNVEYGRSGYENIVPHKTKGHIISINSGSRFGSGSGGYRISGISGGYRMSGVSGNISYGD